MHSRYPRRYFNIPSVTLGGITYCKGERWYSSQRNYIDETACKRILEAFTDPFARVQKRYHERQDEKSSYEDYVKSPPSNLTCFLGIARIALGLSRRMMKSTLSSLEQQRK